MIRVRVRDFQSIEDEEVVVDGLTVVTGPNNSGKTAFMRAVKGVFTNAAPGPLVRRGAAYLSVCIAFDDGSEVLWEKGWEKPGRKGKTVNRYVVNGVSISNVGRGVPPEVEQLGVGEIKAASDRIWPQIAQQFDGTLFLVNRPGSAVAEALSDVERVGKLTDALRLSEKDKRSFSSELKVRIQDLTEAEGYAAKFNGLEEVLELVESLRADQKDLSERGVRLEAATALSERLASAQGQFQPLENFASLDLPDDERVVKIATALQVITEFHRKRETCCREIESFKDFNPSTPQTRVESLRSSWVEVGDLNERLCSGRASLGELDLQGEKALLGLKRAENDVLELLGERGICPTCDTVHEVAS